MSKLKAKDKQSSRIIALDLMRGYFLISIAINHLFYPSAASLLTMKGQLFVSSAEGFFFISGIVLGIVRGAKLASQPFKIAASALLRRALQLYIVYVVAAVLFTLIGWWFFMDNPGLKSGIASAETPILTMIWNVLTFQYLYGWLDYLRLYCFFMVISPLVILLLRKGWWWLVLSTSFAVWLFAPQPDWPANVYTQPYNWQLIFFGGMTIGYHWKQLATLWNAIPQIWRKVAISTLVSAAVATLAFNIFLSFGGKLGDNIYSFVAPLREHLSPYFNKENLPPARISMFLLWFWSSFWFFHRYEKAIIKYAGKLLLPFGTNSLYVYIMSGILIFFIHLTIPKSSYMMNLLVNTALVALIWFMVQKKFLMKIIPR